MKIVFIGATGMLGKPVAKQLISDKHEITLCGRDENKLKTLFPSATAVRADVFDKASLQKAFTGQEAVYLNLSIDQSSKEKDPQTEREGIDTIIAAAEQTGIKRLVYLSSLVHFYQGMNGFNWWAFRIKNDAAEKLKTSGIPSTIFYPSTFMETFPYQVKRGKKIATMGKSLVPMWFISAGDYARQVARSFALAPTGNKEYPVQGPEAWRFDEAASIFINNYQKEKLSIQKAPSGLVKFIGNFSPKLNYVWHICEALNKYPEKFESQQTWDELGIPGTRLADYAKSL